jgi:isopenicillin-N N-acyltransferase-like protein
MIRRMQLNGSPETNGATHGTAHHEDVRHYTRDRVGLAGTGTWSGHPATEDQVLELAEEMLPSHERYAPDLHAEMVSMAGAAGISPAEAVVVGGFTDFVDAVRDRFGDAPQEDTCTAAIVPDAAAAGGDAVFGQTWDMHDSATQHIVLLEIAGNDHPAAMVFTTVGCVGQIGMNEAGLCVGINNLTAANGKVGVTWPFVVRKALQQTDLDDAVECVLDADLAGGHNFLLLDASGRGVNLEAMPQAVKVTEVTETPFVHTNHTLEPETTRHQAARPEGLMASSIARLERAREVLGNGPASAEDLMELTRDPEAVCQVAAEPYHIESCGAAVMRPRTGDFWAVWGRPDQNEYEHSRLR